MKTRVFAVCAVFFLFLGTANAGISDGLVAYYPFNGNANDESGHGNNGIVNGATLTTDRNGNVNSAYSFDGVNSCIDLTSTTVAIQGNAARTVTAWIKTTFTGSQAIVATGFPAQSQTFNVVMYYPSSGCVGHVVVMGYYHDFYVCGGSSGIVSTDGAWHMMAVVYDGLETLRIYADGIIDNETSITYATTGQKNYIGRSNHVGAEAFFRGSIDEVRIYNRALSSTEIQQLYRGQGTCSNDIVTFTAGTPAKAAEVNANFDLLRCQMQAMKAAFCQEHPTASMCQ